MLVRESAFHPHDIGNHDYLRVPEIIEDICNGYQKHFEESIYDLIVAGLKPCVVKFEVTALDRHDLTKAALSYCHCKIHGRELWGGANTCYDAAAQPITGSQIVRVEFL